MLGLARFVRNVTSTDKDRRLAALGVIARLLLGNYRLTWHQLDWFGDAGFNGYLEEFGELHGFNAQRRWMLWQLLRLTHDVDGHTAECGVFEGAGSWLICAANRHRSPGYRHHLFDSFAGLSEPDPIDGRYWAQGNLAAPEEAVLERLTPFAPVVSSHKGWIPERFDEVRDKRFSFVHIDVDLYAPTRNSIEFFYPRLNDGAILVCDDYGFSSCPGATAAVDEYLRDKPEKMLSLDSGGGFLIRGVGVASTDTPLAPSERSAVAAR